MPLPSLMLFRNCISHAWRGNPWPWTKQERETKDLSNIR
jgi:hypothetical protein